MKNKVLKHFGTKIVDEWSNECDFYIYEESTADGYSIWVATQNPENITVEENVYYYDSDLSMALYDALLYYNCKNIYIDDPEAHWVEEAINELSDWIDEQEDE
jgi:hypothetical protein